MSRTRECVSSLALAVILAAPASADTVTLKSGKAVEGQFTGASSDTVRVLLSSGSLVQIPVGDIVSITFSPRPAAALAAAHKPAPDPARAPAPIVVPAGTAINVRLTQAIDVDASRASQTFKARVDDPVMIDGKVVIPREATATLQAVAVQQSGKMKGADKITLKMNNVGFGGRVYEVVTTMSQSSGKGEGKRTTRKIGGGVGLGALVGGIAGGGEGAVIGAAIGGVTGAAVAGSGEEHLQIPAETRLQFTLSAAIKVLP